MTHEQHHENKLLQFFASPLQERSHQSTLQNDNPSSHSSFQEHHDPKNQNQSASDDTSPAVANADTNQHDMPVFHRHAEATTAELFYDLCEHIPLYYPPAS